MHEFIVPAALLNECAGVHPVGKEEWEQKWRDANKLREIEFLKVLDELVADGLIVIATDHDGQRIYRNGQIVYKISEQAKRLAQNCPSNHVKTGDHGYGTNSRGGSNLNSTAG